MNVFCLKLNLAMLLIEQLLNFKSSDTRGDANNANITLILQVNYERKPEY